MPHSAIKRSRSRNRTVVAYAAAAIVGFALASYRYLVPASGDGIEGSPSPTSAPIGAADSPSPAEPVAPGHRAGAPESSTRTHRSEAAQDDDAGGASGLVFAGEGLVLRPELAGDRFIGFIVVRNDNDSRFAVGDVIISVNEQPVENSAAGSELLIASLADPDTPVEIRAAKH